jgi:hypothetical protein
MAASFVPEVTHEEKNVCDPSLSDVEVRIVSIPGDWCPPVPGVFIRETMNNLVDMGEKMGVDPASWSNEPPGF